MALPKGGRVCLICLSVVFVSCRWRETVWHRAAPDLFPRAARRESVPSLWREGQGIQAGMECARVQPQAACGLRRAYTRFDFPTVHPDMLGWDGPPAATFRSHTAVSQPTRRKR